MRSIQVNDVTPTNGNRVMIAVADSDGGEEKEKRPIDCGSETSIFKKVLMSRHAVQKRDEQRVMNRKRTPR